LSLIAVLAVGGVGLGVAALIVVLSVLDGFETNLMVKLLGLNSHVTVYKFDQTMTGWPETVAKIRSVEGVRTVMPMVRGEVMISTRKGANALILMGLDPASAAESDFFDALNPSPESLENLVQRPMKSPYEAPPDEFGRPQYFPELDSPPIGMEMEGDVQRAFTQRPLLIGRELSYTLDAPVLSLVQLVSPFGRVTPLGNRAPLNRLFTIGGHFQANYYDFDTTAAFTSMTEAQDLLGMNRDEINLIEVYVDDIYQAEEIKKKIVSALDDPSIYARDWMQSNMSLFSALKLEQTAMFIILTLIILVAAFNIASTLIMMVSEKTRDIAILKAMGANSKQIRRIFTLQGLIVGGVGTLAGLVVGVTLCLLLERYEFITLPPEVYLLSTLPVEMRPAQIAATVVVSIFISYLATLYPASQAAKQDPVEALRYE
jgi:lipoprotein-releasing system permease protein